MSPVGRAAFVSILAACAGEPPRAVLVAATPDLACPAQGGVVVDLRGRGLQATVADVQVSPALYAPSVRLEPRSGLSAGTPTDAGASTPPSRWRSDRRITVDLGPGIAPAVYEAIVTDAAGRDAATALGVVGRPDIRTLTPEAVCQDAGAVTVAAGGPHFVVRGGDVPTVTVGGEAVEVTPGDCAPLAGGLDGELCATLAFEVDGTRWGVGSVPIEVTGITEAACTSFAPAYVRVVPPPVLDAVEPGAVCVTGGATVLVTGSDLDGVSEVWIGGVAAVAVEVVDSTTLAVTLDPATPAGVQDVRVVAPSGCAASLADALDVAPPPVVWGVVPDALYAPIGGTVSVFVSGLVAATAGVVLEGPGGRVTPSWTHEGAGTITVEVPAALAAGTWSVEVTDADGCTGAGTDLLVLEDDPTVAVVAVEPAHAWAFDRTPLVLTAADPPGAGRVGFADGARVDLVGPAPERGAVALLGVQVDGPERLRATVPEGLAVGRYDVLVTQPGGAVGWLPDALSVAFAPPPTITEARPGTLPSDVDAPIRVIGRDFRDPTVTIACDDGREWDAPVLAWDFGEIEALVPARDIDRGVCTVAVENGDGARAVWAAFTVTNPAQNLYPWSDAPPLTVGRRAPSAAAARISPVDRRVWAIGGDPGAAIDALSSVEVASVGLYGDLGAWRVLPLGLPSPRTLAGTAVVERFIYLLGGHDGSAPTAAVDRALTLDPSDAPAITDVSLADAAGAGLGGGRWRYAVAAVHAPGDPANPDGEALASAPVVLDLPELPDGLAPTVAWSPVAGAVAYRVYRSPEADAAAESLCRVAEVSATAWTDPGATADCAWSPLPDGSLGRWAALPPLPETRESPCVAVVADPARDPEVRHIFVAGGRTVAGELLDTLVRLDVELVSPAHQEVGEWVELAVRLPGGRVRCGAWALDARLHTVVAEDESWLYVGGGADDRRATGDVWAGRVVAGGELVDWGPVDGLSPARAGFAPAAASDFLYAFGGQNDRPSTGGVSTAVEGGALPELVNWNSLGVGWGEGRWLPGIAQESAVLVTVGGATDAAPATASVEVTTY